MLLVASSGFMVASAQEAASDLDIAEANIKAMASFASENGVSMRPHMKTAKSADVAGLVLIAAGPGFRKAEARKRFDQLIDEFPESQLAPDAKRIGQALAKDGF